MTSPSSPPASLKGLPVIPKGVLLTGAKRAAFLAKILPVYRQGASIREIAEQTHRSYGSIQRLLGDAGVLRGRGGGPHERRSGVPRS